MSDLISRQAAIDAIDDIESEVADGFGFQYEKWRKHFAELPPTQPEIVRCKDCKHHWTYKSMDRMPIEICDLEQTFYDAEHDFCSLAERRKNG